PPVLRPLLDGSLFFFSLASFVLARSRVVPARYRLCLIYFFESVRFARSLGKPESPHTGLYFYYADRSFFYSLDQTTADHLLCPDVALRNRGHLYPRRKLHAAGGTPAYLAGLNTGSHALAPSVGGLA